MVLFVLLESAVGFALFELKEFDETSATEATVQKQVSKFETFSKIAHLKAFFPFDSAPVTLNNAFKVAQGKVTEELTNFLSENLPLVKKKEKVILGVNDNKLAGAISEALGIQTISSKVVLELVRGFRAHFIQFLKNPDLDENVLSKAQLGLAHAFSRNKISLDVNREDKPIIQSISLLELLDKDVNTLSMRIREWFSWHFPELPKLLTDNNVFVRVAHLIKNRDDISEILASDLEEIVTDAEIAERILELAKNSMGQEMSEFDTVSYVPFRNASTSCVRRPFTSTSSEQRCKSTSRTRWSTWHPILPLLWVRVWEPGSSPMPGLSAVCPNTLLPQCRFWVPRRLSSGPLRPRQILPNTASCTTAPLSAEQSARTRARSQDFWPTNAP